MNPRPTAALLVALFALLIASSVEVVDQRATALLLQFDEIKSADLAPGLHWKIPFIQRVKKFDRRIREDSQTDTVPTGDEKTLDVELSVLWRIADPAAYYRSTNGQDLVAADRLMAVVNRSLHDAFASRSLEAIVTEPRSQIDDALHDGLAAKAQELGIQVVDVKMTSLGLSKSIADAYYDRMRAERHRIAQGLRARGDEDAETIRAQADSEAQTTLSDAYRKAEGLRGEGDAKASEIYAQAYGQDADFFAFYRSLESYRAAFGKNDVLVLEPKGEFFKYFKDSGGKPANEPGGGGK
jgi:membrane protease subunit HflC